jgi:hypothetical protein
MTHLALASIPAALAAATLIGVGPAYASGGGGSGSGGGGGIPGGTSSATFCPFPGVQQLPGDASMFGVEANGAGCVVVYVFDAGGAMVPNQIVVAPGWTDQNKSDPGSPGHFADRVDVVFTQSGTGDRVEVLVEPGKTEVK